MRLHNLLSNSTPVPIHPAGPVTSLRWRGRLQFRGGDVTLLVTPGFPVPQPMALYHLDSDILIIILQQLHNFATLWNIRRVCLEFFRLVMGDTKSNELFFNLLRRSTVPIEFLPTLDRGIHIHFDSRPMMMLVVHNYNRSLCSLFRMMHYNMLMDLCLYNEDVVFFTNDNNQLQQHPFTFPVLSLQSLILELGVTLDDYMASLLKREQDETHDDLQCKKKIIVRAIIGADTLGLGSWDGDLSDIFAAYNHRLDGWLEEPNNQRLAHDRQLWTNGRRVLATHPITIPWHRCTSLKTMCVELHYKLEGIIQDQGFIPMFQFKIHNRTGCIDSLLQFRSESAKCLQRAGYFNGPDSELDLEAGIRKFVESMVRGWDKTLNHGGLLFLYGPICVPWEKRLKLFPILRAAYSCASFEGSELLFMLKKMYGHFQIDDENDIWVQFISSKRKAYAPHSPPRPSPYREGSYGNYIH
jgi:hypothetical protein